MDASQQDLANLLELQRINSALDILDHRRRVLPEQARVDDLTAQLEACQRVIGDQQSKVDDLAGRQRRMDGDIETIAAKISAEEARLYAGNISTPKELSSIQAEIESLKRRRSTIEDSDLEVMELRETEEGELSRLTVKLDELQSQFSEAEKARDMAMSSIAAELEQLNPERDVWRGKIDAGLLELYEDLRSSKGGIGAAALHEGACLGCHMKLPAQEVARIRKEQGLVRCVECRRILVVKP